MGQIWNKVKIWWASLVLKFKSFFDKYKKVKPVAEPTQTNETKAETVIESFPQNNVANPPAGLPNAVQNAADIKTNSEKMDKVMVELKKMIPPEVISFGERLKRFLDWNNDGVLDAKDAGRFFTDLLLIFLGVLTGISVLMGDKILAWIDTGVPNYTVIVGTILGLFISAAGALLRRKWAESASNNEQKITALSSAVQTGKNLLQQSDLQHQAELYAKDLYYLNLIKITENKAALLQGQLQLANDIKKMVLDNIQQ
jgi:hypothetical protein